MENKRTVVIGASTNPDRYSYKATVKLTKHAYPAIPVGLKEGEIGGIKILTGKPEIDNVDTVTLYIGPQNQPGYYEYILGLHPKRIIFNPGTENPEFEELAKNKGIEVVEACTLVMLSIGNY